MSLAKNYNPAEVETRLDTAWQTEGLYGFERDARRPIYSIDTPPPTVSGHLHLGHVFSYSHPDFMARFYRMRGYNVFYPMGFDDNGLPTERLVEKRYGITAAQVGRAAFIRRCLEVSEEAEKDYRSLWQRLGLSIDWRYTYRSIDANARRIAQLSFLRLLRSGRAYRRSAPTIWCPECHTAVAQAELEDRERQTEFVTLPFMGEDGQILPIATTRPELLPACVAVFVHPEDGRFTAWIGKKVRVPLFDRWVNVLSDAGADPQKGTGAVMCCTFGDQADMNWWYAHQLPLVEAIDRTGRMTAAAGMLAGMKVSEARQAIKRLLAEAGLLFERIPLAQSVRVHERCDTPVEIVVSAQWFIRILDRKERLLELGDAVRWHPAQMQSRYRAWVENLSWDWAISRQRAFGVPFPLWVCQDCGAILPAEEDELPMDPAEKAPRQPCACGGCHFEPDPDVMDTWATSSLSPQIAGRWLEDPELYAQVAPYSLRPQAHEIIRTWAFYTLVRSDLHFNRLPWSDILISGWGLAGEGMGKISKSKGGGPMAPLEMIQRFSADALRYWAASTSPGKDAVISEEKIQMGQRLVIKLWNVARFSERFLAGQKLLSQPDWLSAADHWLLAECQELVRQVTMALEQYEYALAKSEIESFFWVALCDNYLEMAKQRLYSAQGAGYEAACFTLQHVLLSLLKLLAPFLPYVCDEIYRELFAGADGRCSVHAADWPLVAPGLDDPDKRAWGATLISILTALRKHKTESKLGLATTIMRVQLGTPDSRLAAMLHLAESDLTSAARAQCIEVVDTPDPSLLLLWQEQGLSVAIEPNHPAGENHA